MITTRASMGGSGTQTATLAFGGGNPPGTYLIATEEYNGTAWATKNSMATARRSLGGSGSTSAALGFGGYSGSKSAVTEEFTAPVGTANITSS